MSCGCIYTQELEVWSLHYMYMPHDQKLKCHHYVMTLWAFGLGAIGVNRIEFQAPVIYFLNLPENRGKGH